MAKETGVRTVKGIIFDLDGTVIDTERFAIGAWPNVALKRGYAVTEAMARRFVGLNDTAEREILFAAYGDAFPYDEIRNDLRTLFMETAVREGIPVKKGFAELLAEIKRLALPYALATSTSRDFVGWKLERAGLSGVFPLIVCSDEVEHGKPAPDIFLKAAEIMAQKPQDCIGIEDSEAGLRGLRDANIRSVFIKDIVTPASDALKTVWRQLPDLTRVCALLNGEIQGIMRHGC
jgi:HAD superfamily hydrolase (TIGR01509 family)